MAKKSSKQPIPLLSPEKYIRNNSRTLPIAMCRVNHDWETDGIANILIAREHTNGNFTACMYLVDLYCLGVKDTMYIFNETPSALNDIVKQMNTRLKMIDIPYHIAHNIILESVEFAGDYGFLPHKDFLQTTSFFLEEDNEDIPAAEIKCGKNGKPFYINTGFESKIREQQILAQLEKTAGKDGFDFADDFYDDDEFEDDDFDDDDDDFYDDEYFDDDDFDDDEFFDDGDDLISEMLEIRENIKALSFEERKEMFLKIRETVEEEEVEQRYLLQLFALTDMFTSDIIDEEKQNSYYDKLYQDLYVEELFEIDELPNSFCEGLPEDGEEIADLYLEFDETEDEESQKKLLKLMKIEAGDVPMTGFCELAMMHSKNGKKYTQLLQKLREKFPDYPLFKALHYSQFNITELDKTEREKTREEIKAVIANRERLTFMEYDQLILAYYIYSLPFANNPDELDLEELSAYSKFLFEIDIEEETKAILSAVITFKKQDVIQRHLEKK